ncbi:MAG: COG1615 family transporter [Clostridia bacterium]|nr:COG1615 family transporter [Clostridia bacterium]
MMLLFGIYGAGITDVTIKLWGYRLLSIVIVISTWKAIGYFKEKKTKNVIISVLTVPIYLVCLFVVMVGFKLIYINTNELDKEKQYIKNNIDNTKAAYHLRIDETEILNDDTQNLKEIENNAKVIDNISLVTEEVTLKTLGVTQTSTGYYSYRNTNISQYEINGKDEIVYIAPREIISSGNRTYNNKTYEYTHGFGAIVTSATSTDEMGNVKYIQKDFTVKNQPIHISQPRIYFGLETNNTIVTNSDNKTEFDYPTTTSQNAEYSYDGAAGLALNFIDRMILALRQKDINLALSSNVSNDSKILINRNIIQRAKTILPNVIYDEEPYMVISQEGKLVWVLDAYTTTNKYPYSQPITIEHNGTRQEINYIRNSLKVLIDAYDGTTKFYITDTSDPIIMAYKNMYPNLFETETIPKDISSHFVYPEFLYNIQAEILQMYHNVSTDVLYRGDDIWEIAKYSRTTQTSTKGIKQEPYYTMLKTIDSNQMELGLVTSYTLLDKQSLKAYLVGTYDEYGNAKLRLYKFPQDTNILGPMQLETLLGQDETISKELESINISGMRTIKNMIAVPINNTVLYVQPIYQISLNETKSIPTLKKVVVACGNKVAIDDTLKGAIKNLLSQSALNIEVENTDTIEDLIEAVIKANNNLQTSSNNNDWEMIGKDMKKLQDLINKLEELKEEEDKKKQIQNQLTTNQNILTDDIQNNV